MVDLPHRRTDDGHFLSCGHGEGEVGEYGAGGIICEGDVVEADEAAVEVEGYEKETLSKRMEPPWRWRGGAFGTSLGGGFSSTSLKRTSMSRRFCLISRYIDPRKLSGRESWKISWLTMTTSPTVIVPIHKKARSERKEGGREGGGNRKHTINDALCSQKHRHGQCA